MCTPVVAACLYHRFVLLDRCLGEQHLEPQHLFDGLTFSRLYQLRYRLFRKGQRTRALLLIDPMLQLLAAVRIFEPRECGSLSCDLRPERTVKLDGVLREDFVDAHTAVVDALVERPKRALRL